MAGDYSREELAGPIRFTPEEAGYRFQGEAAIGRLLTGIVGLPPFWRPKRS
jgi:hypothetical protein